MSKRVSKLNQFGIFRDFAWDTNRLDDLGRYDLLYGWNYSGKTTLARVFSALQAPKKPLAYPGGTFEVQRLNPFGVAQ